MIEPIVDEITDIKIDSTQIAVEDNQIEIQTDIAGYSSEVEEPEAIEVVVSEGLNGGISLKVSADHSQYLPDQHTIGAITGLREELDEIERLKSVYSDGKNQANYYMWKPGVLSDVDKAGYFVSINPDDNLIKLCSSNEDVIGITVNAAGFIGGQDAKAPRDDKYALVVHSGIVAVRCELDPNNSEQPCVKAGDYVVSNDYGIAKKTDETYGYRVVAISKIDGVWHAIISLLTPTTQMQYFSETAQDVTKRMGSAEENIAAAISVANAAYNKAQVAHNWAQGNVENIAGNVTIIGGKVDNIITDVDNLKGSVADSTAQSNTAYEIAKQTKKYASDTRTEVNEQINDAYDSINDLTDAVAPITTWKTVDKDGNKLVGARYYVEHVDNNFLKTKTAIEEVQNLTEENKTAISQNAENIQLMATSIDKYSVGEWSQAYGLTLSQAWSILNPGMIYIPTPITHTEKYEYKIVEVWDEQDKDTSMIYKEAKSGLYWRSVIAKDENDNLVNQWESIDLTTTDGTKFIIDDTEDFTKGYYYTWNGFYWVESEHPYVYFSAVYVNPSAECQYWYRETDEDLVYENITYKARALYTIINNKWVEVNILDGNVTNRVVSMINQTANSISLEIANARGDIADLNMEVGKQGAQVGLTAAKVDDAEPSDIELTGIVESFGLLPTGAQKGNYYAIGKKVYRYNGTEWKEQYHLMYDGANVKKINVANIIASVNADGDSVASIKADRINFDGVTTFTFDEANNITGIVGDSIKTGYIKSNNYAEQDGYVMSGTLLNLYNGSISTPNFQLDQYGNVSMAGRITATSGYIADFVIDHVNNWYYYGGLAANAQYYFVLDNVNYYFTTSSDIALDDILLFTTSTPQPMLIYGNVVLAYDNRKDIPNNTQLISLTQGHSYIANNQYLLTGSEFDATGRPYKGVYIAPDGIGLGNGNFYVDNTGNLTMGGNITMQRYIVSNGKISTYPIFTINNSGITMNSVNSSGSIKNMMTIDDSGNMTLNGSIQLNGSITWGANSSPTLVLYGEDAYSVYVNGEWPNYADAPDNSEEEWHKKCSADDLYAIYSYDGGRSWTENPIRFRGEDGEPGEPGEPGANGNELSDYELFEMLTANGSTQGIFPFYAGTSNGNDKLFINASYIKSGTISANRISTEIAQVNSDLSIGDISSSEGKVIRFTDTATIGTMDDLVTMRVSAPYMRFVDLESADDDTPAISANGQYLATQDWVEANFSGGSSGSVVARFG